MLLVALTVAVLALPGCRRPRDVVRLGYLRQIGHAQAILAIESGELGAAIAPKRLEAIAFNGGPSIIEAILAGEIDMAYVGPAPIITATERTRGRGLRVVAGAATDGVTVVARKDAGIGGIADLPRARIATPQMANSQDVAARHLMRVLGGDGNNVVPVQLTEQSALLAQGRIDVAWVPEPWGQKLVEEAGAREVADERVLLPGEHRALTLVAATPEFLASHRADVVAILRVHCAWTERLRRDPLARVDALAAGLGRASGRAFSRDVLARAITRVNFTNDASESSLRTMAAWMRDLGFLHREPHLDGLVDPSAREAACGAVPQ